MVFTQAQTSGLSWLMCRRATVWPLCLPPVTSAVVWGASGIRWECLGFKGSVVSRENKYLGVFIFTMSTKITDQQVKELATQFGFPYNAVRAFIKVESSGNGFVNGKITIQFEPHIFKRYTKKVINNGVEGQTQEWKAFNEAWKIDPEATMLSTSYGMGQIMGFNHKAAGFSTVGAMLDAFKTGEYQQVKGMLNFIKNNVNLRTAMKNLDWKKLAYYYNGSQYAVNAYDKKLKAAYEKYEASS